MEDPNIKITCIYGAHCLLKLNKSGEDLGCYTIQYMHEFENYVGTFAAAHANP